MVRLEGDVASSDNVRFFATRLEALWICLASLGSVNIVVRVLMSDLEMAAALGKLVDGITKMH